MFRGAFGILSLTSLAALTALPASSADAAAGAQGRVAHGSRVELVEVIPKCAPKYCAVDLGRAPLPGKSRVLTRREIKNYVRDAGLDASAVRVARSIRVRGAAKRLTPAQLAKLAAPRVRAQLKTGIKLVRLQTQRTITVSPEATLARITIPRMPRRAGPHRSTATLEFVAEGRTQARVSATLHLDISEDAARPDIAKGAQIMLVIRRGTATISTAGTALKGGDIGETIQFRVVKTGRVIRARVDSPRRASVASL